MMFQTIRKVSFSTKYFKIIHIHAVFFLPDCPKWKEEHSCNSSLIRDLCKKTCGFCGTYVLYSHEGYWLRLMKGCLIKTKAKIIFFAESEPKSEPDADCHDDPKEGVLFNKMFSLVYIV